MANPEETEQGALTTGELARRTGLTLRAVRFYEEAGLLIPARTPSGRRAYCDSDVVRLQFIADLRELDLSLEEIGELLMLRDGCKDAPELAGKLRAIVAEQLARTERRLSALQRLREEFVATRDRLDACGSCAATLPAAPCTACDVMGEAPRFMRLVVAKLCAAAAPRCPSKVEPDDALETGPIRAID